MHWKKAKCLDRLEEYFSYHLKLKIYKQFNINDVEVDFFVPNFNLIVMVDREDTIENREERIKLEEADYKIKYIKSWEIANYTNYFDRIRKYILGNW